MKLNKWICAKKKANGLYFYKGHNQKKIDLRMFCENSLFDLLFLMNLSVFPWGFCLFWKGTMYGYLYWENRGLERLPGNVGFIPNLSINVENFFLCF